MSRRLELSLENRAGTIADTAAEIQRFCEPLGLSQREIGLMNLALDEVLTNIVSYAWPEGGRHTARVVLAVEGPRLIAEVTDDGVPFDPRTVPRPDFDAPLEERRVGGLGVYFALTLMDHVDYERVGDENRLTLVKVIS